MDDPHIALAAVIVTGVVGVVGPIVTWRATVDVTRSGQRAERRRADLAELRSVVDNALADQAQAGAAGSRVTGFFDRVLEAQFDNANADDTLQRKRYQRWIASERGFTKAMNAASRDATRLEIRLGND